jgi:hypothetical protein
MIGTTKGSGVTQFNHIDGTGRRRKRNLAVPGLSETNGNIAAFAVKLAISEEQIYVFWKPVNSEKQKMAKTEWIDLICSKSEKNSLDNLPFDIVG